MAKKPHVCDARCVCPTCGAALFYSEHYDQHACSVASCAWLDYERGKPALVDNDSRGR